MGERPGAGSEDRGRPRSEAGGRRGGGKSPQRAPRTPEEWEALWDSLGIGTRLPDGSYSGGTPDGPSTFRAGWPQILPHWRLVVADLSRIHGVDLTDPAAWNRPWAPLRSLILTLPGEPTSRLRRALGGD